MSHIQNEAPGSRWQQGEFVVISLLAGSAAMAVFLASSQSRIALLSAVVAPLALWWAAAFWMGGFSALLLPFDVGVRRKVAHEVSLVRGLLVGSWLAAADAGWAPAFAIVLYAGIENRVVFPRLTTSRALGTLAQTLRPTVYGLAVGFLVWKFLLVIATGGVL
jgi:hypothetical protein